MVTGCCKPGIFNVFTFLIIQFPGKKYCVCRLFASGPADKAGAWRWPSHLIPSMLASHALTCPFANGPTLQRVVVCGPGGLTSSVWGDDPRRLLEKGPSPGLLLAWAAAAFPTGTPESAGGRDSWKLARLQMMGRQTSPGPQA